MAARTQKKNGKDSITMSGTTIPDKLPVSTINSFRKSVLDWYDQHHRVLPWRAHPGTVAEPYHVWLSEIMLQQTVVAAVTPYFQKFVTKWPSVHDLAQAQQDDVLKEWAGLGYYARARNLHRCAQVISTEYKGFFPQTETDLKSLPGVGDYTAAAIQSIAFNAPSVVVDGNVERVMSRYFAITKPLPDSKLDIRKAAGILASGRTDRPSDYAQALMDLGATICIPKTPRCPFCPLQKNCQAKKLGIQNNLPAKAPKNIKPNKKGFVYFIKNEDLGLVLLEKRPEKGLFGGMMGFPTSEWLVKEEIPHPEDVLTWGEPQLLPEHKIKHSFTHFDLELQGFYISTKRAGREEIWIEQKNLLKSGLPSLFQKFARFFRENDFD